jgi:hypothetical protein
MVGFAGRYRISNVLSPSRLGTNSLGTSDSPANDTPLTTKVYRTLVFSERPADHNRVISPTVSLPSSRNAALCRNCCT